MYFTRMVLVFKNLKGMPVRSINTNDSNNSEKKDFLPLFKTFYTLE